MAALQNVTLVNEQLVSNALTVYNSVTQDPTKYGYDKAEWDGLVKAVQDAKTTIRNLKFANASEKVKAVQALIDALPDTFSVGAIDAVKNVIEQMDALQASDRAILDTIKLDAFKASYNEYRNTITEQVTPLKDATDNIGCAIVLTSALALAGLAFVIKRTII